MKKIIVFIFIIFSSHLFAQHVAISFNQIKDILGRNPKIIDIRESRKWKMLGMIPNAYKMSFYNKNGKHNLARWMVTFQKVVKNPNQPFCLVSQNTKKAKSLAKVLSKKGYKKVYYLSGGMTGWVENGGQIIDLDNRPKLK